MCFTHEYEILLCHLLCIAYYTWPIIQHARDTNETHMGLTCVTPVSPASHLQPYFLAYGTACMRQARHI